jgi:hypothetical protein
MMHRRTLAAAMGSLPALMIGANGQAQAQAPVAATSGATAGMPPSIVTPDRVDSVLGPLQFTDGVPTPATAEKLYENLDRARAFDAFVNTFQGVNARAIHRGFLDIGVKDNEILIFSELMDAKSLFLTANADTVYFVGMIDLSKGPMVLETPPEALGTIDDYWWRWVTDFGAPGPDRGLGGKYLLVPPGYAGVLPEGGFYVAHARTTRVLLLGRSFMLDNNPRPAVEVIKRNTRIYPYQPGGQGTSIAEFLAARAPLGRIEPPPAQVFHEGSGRVMNTIPPGDFSAFEFLNEVVQQEPATALDAELMGPLAAIGIVKGRPFAPDERMKRILTETAAVANATLRTLFTAPRDPEWAYYEGSAWQNPLFISGSEFETPIPEITPQGVRVHPPTGYRTMNIRSMFFYGITGITPAMSMRLPGIGSQYLLAFQDAAKRPFDGAAHYRVTLPRGIPEAKFWSFTVYDNQTRSMLDTPQRYPRAGSQSFPSPAATASPDGSTVIHFAPTQPSGVARGNWIQTTPGKGWFVILRLYSPLESFFAKTWRPSEVERVG